MTNEFDKLLRKLPADLHPLLVFIYTTDMRTNAARKLTWEMIVAVLVKQGFLEPWLDDVEMKNGKPHTLPLRVEYSIAKRGTRLAPFVA